MKKARTNKYAAKIKIKSIETINDQKIVTSLHKTPIVPSHRKIPIPSPIDSKNPHSIAARIW